MWGAGIPTIYYGFFCNPNLRLIYWASVYFPACAFFNPFKATDILLLWHRQQVQHLVVAMSPCTQVYHSIVQTLACLFLRWLWP